MTTRTRWESPSTSATQPANGTVVIAADGADLTYEPDPNYCNTQTGGSPDTFTYTLTPGGSTATVSVTVTCVDDPPTAVNDTATVVEDDPATTIDVLANDLDIDDGPITIDQVTQPTNGTVVDHQRRRRPHLPTRRQLLQHPDRRVAGHVHLHPHRRLHRHRQRDGDLCGRRPGRRRRHRDGGRGQRRRRRSTCWPTMSTPDSVGMTIDDVTQPANGTVVVAVDGADLTYQPDANYCNTQTGGSPDTFTYTLTPGGSTATVSRDGDLCRRSADRGQRHGDRRRGRSGDGDRRVGQRHRHRRRTDHHRPGDPARQRDGGDHRRR